jgi:DNA-binding transcriptional LysR family regulator
LGDAEGYPGQHAERTGKLHAHPLASQHAAALPELADDRWIQGWGDTGAVLDTLAATSGIRPRVACRSSDYRFMSALVSAGVGVALIPRLGLPDNPRVRDLAITPQPSRYVGIYRPRRRWQHPAADRLLAALHHQAATMNSHRCKGSHRTAAGL